MYLLVRVKINQPQFVLHYFFSMLSAFSYVCTHGVVVAINITSVLVNVNVCAQVRW